MKRKEIDGECATLPREEQKMRDRNSRRVYDCKTYSKGSWAWYSLSPGGENEYAMQTIFLATVDRTRALWIIFLYQKWSTSHLKIYSSSMANRIGPPSRYYVCVESTIFLSSTFSTGYTQNVFRKRYGSFYFNKNWSMLHWDCFCVSSFSNSAAALVLQK